MKIQRESRYGMEFDHTGVLTLYNQISFCFEILDFQRPFFLRPSKVRKLVRTNQFQIKSTKMGTGRKFVNFTATIPESPVCLRLALSQIFHLLFFDTVKDVSWTKVQPRTTPQGSELGKLIGQNDCEKAKLQKCFEQFNHGLHGPDLACTCASQTFFRNLSWMPWTPSSTRVV